MVQKKYREIKTGLFFGSFNPIHYGHLLIASYMLNFTDLDEIWFVVSPQNPLKKKNTLLANHLRLDMVELAIENQEKMKTSDIEFHLPIPSYTVNTLVYLKERSRGRKFVLIMGTDNLNTIEKWKNYNVILDEYSIYVYPRPKIDPGPYAQHHSVKMTDAPVVEISSSFIRNALGEGKDLTFFLPDKVYQYIKKYQLYYNPPLTEIISPDI